MLPLSPKHQIFHSEQRTQKSYWIVVDYFFLFTFSFSSRSSASKNGQAGRDCRTRNEHQITSINEELVSRIGMGRKKSAMIHDERKTAKKAKNEEEKSQENE